MFCWGRKKSDCSLILSRDYFWLLLRFPSYKLFASVNTHPAFTFRTRWEIEVECGLKYRIVFQNEMLNVLGDHFPFLCDVLQQMVMNAIDAENEDSE